MAKKPESPDSSSEPEVAAEPAAEAPPAPADAPGHLPEPAAVSGAEPVPTPGLAPPGQGAQVVLTGDAQAAARGGLHGDIVANTIARDTAIVSGHIEPATAVAAAEATTGALPDEIDAVEEAAIAKARADAQAARVARAAKSTP